jgi:Ca2+/Na+ antiporter
VTLVGLARDVSSLGVAFLLTGFLAGIIIFPERLQSARRLYLSLALSPLATVLIALPAVAGGRLSILTTCLGLAVLCVVAAARYWRRHGPRRAAATALRDWWQRFRAPRSIVFLVVAGAVSWLVLIGPQVESRRPSGLPLQSTVWWYWWLAEAVAGEGGIPAASPEWGRSEPFQHAYIGSTIHTAAAMQLAGGADLTFQERYRLCLVVLALAAFFALWRRWLPPWWALAASLLALTTTKAFAKLLAYRPETFGLILVAWSGWLLDEAFERRSLRWGSLAGVVAGLAFVSHAEMFLFTGPLWAGIAAARVVGARSRPSRAPPLGDASGGQRGHWLRPTLFALPLCLCTVIAIQAATAAGGRLVSIPGVASDWHPRAPDGTDLTWQLYAAVWRPREVDAPPDQPCADAFFTGTHREPWAALAIRDPTPWQLALLAGLLVLTSVPYLGVAARGRRRVVGRSQALRAFTVGTILILGTLLIVTAICELYDTYVPQRTGMLRIQPYYTLGLAGVVGLLGWLSSRGSFALLRLLPFLRTGRRRVRLAAFLAVGLVSLALVPLMKTETPEGTASGISPAAYEAYRWLDHHAPPDAVVLANAFTDGQIAAISHRTGWLDGRLPFLEGPAFIRDSVTMLMEARRYFSKPGPETRVGNDVIDYVVAAEPTVYLGGPYARRVNPFLTDPRKLDEQPDLRLVATFGRGSVHVYEVVR